jgi:hypothetical protein
MKILKKKSTKLSIPEVLYSYIIDCFSIRNLLPAREKKSGVNGDNVVKNSKDLPKTEENEKKKKKKRIIQYWI